MQDRYAGDVGDFSKIVLAKALCKHVGGPLGVLWYLYPSPEANNDGRHRDYFGHRNWEGCDEELQSVLHSIAHGDQRCVANLEASGILPPDTRYFAEPIHRCTPDRRRHDWFARALQAVQGSRTVFVDPDNGIAGPNHNIRARDGGKHITAEEIRHLAAHHPCLAIYRHFDRSAKHEVQIARKLTQLSHLVPVRTVQALRYKRISPRAYFLVSDADATECVARVCAELTTGPWERHFTHYPPDFANATNSSTDVSARQIQESHAP
jgi:hypothetical protein